jgi:hypothetical protein
MKRTLKLVTLLTLGLAIIAIPSTIAITSANADCGVPSVVKDLLKKASEECKKQEGSDATLKECSNKPSILVAIKNIWNQIVGPDSAATIGPRLNNFNVAQNGKALVPGGRLFYTQVSDKDTVSFKITKRGGKAGCDISICAVDENGVPTPLGKVSFAPDAEVGKEISQSVNLSKGKVLQLYFDPNGGLARAFEFTLLTSK